ncbi:zinc finger protein 407 [Cololabis saira]|uniref:zinc finger protein 407 n=1 Tax=Cololabis saira TaxID=129043 RepID=UPI002AD59B8C|nr:zinc finger protein 407 [Cololabis saira]
MDKTLISGEELVENKVPENSKSGNVNPEDVDMEETTGDSGNKAVEPDKADEELAERPLLDSAPEGGDNLCKVCGFSAKHSRSLKIHYARKHGKDHEQNQNISDASPDELQQETVMETDKVDVKQNQRADVDTLNSAENDKSRNFKNLSKKHKILDKEQMGQEELIPCQERRASKRTPKPKIIHSCNYCGQEFRDKSPLDVHIARYHAKDAPYTFDGDENISEKEDEEDQGSIVKPTPTREASKSAPNRFQLKCANCDFRVSTAVVLDRHVRTKHPELEWYRCKLCNFFAATPEWMDAHLSSDSHLQQQKGNECTESSSAEVFVERVSRESVGNDANQGNMNQMSGAEGITTLMEGQLETDEAAEAALSVLVEDDEDAELEPPKKKRGRPKQGSTTTCEYCGLVMSNATNLTVHVRRKHSKDYGYSCTLCNYSCVTKGDMDRHCFTKKHVKRAQDGSNKNQAASHTSPSESEDVTTQNSASQSPDKKQESDSVVLPEHKVEEPNQSDARQQKTKYDSVNACHLCDFVAQSIPSLHLHVKREHTKDFEYVCLACGYYAVTNREMYRHASSEKHKQKSQRYQEEREGQTASDLPEKQKEVTEPSGENSNPSNGSGSCSTDGEVMETENTSASAVTTEVVSAVVSAVGSADEKQAQAITSSTGNEADLTNQTTELTVLSEPQQASTELPLSGEESAQLEGQKERCEQTGDDNLKTEVVIVDKQMSKAPPFDACIVSVKTLTEQEQALQESLALEGEASVICLTGGSLSGFMTRNFTHVRKLKSKEVKVKEEAKASSRIRCEDCGFMADGISGLNVHISMKHPSKERHFHCLVCGKSFYTEGNLHQHLTSAAHLRNEQNSVEELPEGGSSFKCVKCTDRFESEQDLFFHIKEKHEELLREVNKYVVEDTEQINREREENQGSVCKYCGKVCKSSNSMAFLAHIRTHTGSKPFMCKICNFATAQLGDARNHVKRHLGMREYKCDICGWAFVMKKHLSTHLLGKHGVGQRKERKFECQLCDRSFSEKWALNNHMKLHSGEKPYKCAWPSCHYAFLNLSAMKDHYRTHTGEKSYLCDLCGFAGGTRHALTKHRRQHTGERPFKCKLCNFASTTQSHLSRHKRVHTGEKPYRCPWCDYRSNCAENIRKHILHTGKHEGVKMYNCPKCDHATNSPMEFRNHLKESHSDIENPDLAYLHAGIVSKSFECRLKGQGATFVEAEAAEALLQRKDSPDASGAEGPIQQVIIIQGYGDGEVAIDQALEESAAATLQTLAMAGQVAEVLHITEDGQVIASGREVASTGAHLDGTSTQYVVLDSGDARKELRAMTGGAVALAAAAGQSHAVSESSTALDALLSAVSEMGHQEEKQGEPAVVHEVLAPQMSGVEVKEEPEELQVIQETSHENMHEVLQLAASQMMKEGLTQVIVNDEGTHYIVTGLDDCTFQVEGDVYREAEAAVGAVQQVEQQAGEEMVVYLDGAPHNIVLEG